MPEKLKMTCFAIFTSQNPPRPRTSKRSSKIAKRVILSFSGAEKLKTNRFAVFHFLKLSRPRASQGPANIAKRVILRVSGAEELKMTRFATFQLTQLSQTSGLSPFQSCEAGHFEVFGAENLKTIRFATFQLPRPSRASEDPHNVMKSFGSFPKLLFPKWGKFIWGPVL